MTWYWPYAVGSSSICLKRFADLAMSWSTCNRLVQMKERKLRKLLAIIALFEGLCSVGTHFRYTTTNSASPRLWAKRLSMLPSCTFMAVSMMLNMWHWSRYCMRYSWADNFVGDKLDPAHIWCQRYDGTDTYSLVWQPFGAVLVERMICWKIRWTVGSKMT